MSNTTPAEYHGFHFWVFDVCESILFAEMAAVASQAPVADRSEWLAGLEHQLRVHAIIGADFAIPLGQWCDGHEEQFLALATEAARRLTERGTVTAQEAVAWIVLDDRPIIWRGQDAVDIDAIAAFAQALGAIIRGTHPQAPPGHEWFFGHPITRTIQVRQPRPPIPAEP